MQENIGVLPKMKKLLLVSAIAVSALCTGEETKKKLVNPYKIMYEIAPKGDDFDYEVPYNAATDEYNPNYDELHY